MAHCLVAQIQGDNVSAATTFINVEPSDVFVVVDVMTNERRSNEGVEDVIV